MTALTVGDVNLDVGGRDDETELDRITREDIYRQRIYSNTFKKVEGTFEVDTHKWKSWELAVYLGLVGLLMWYSLVRFDVKATYYVSEAVRASFGEAERMDWDPPVMEQIEKEGARIVALETMSTPEEVASWATFYLTQAILPSIQGFTMPFGAIRMTNRRVELIQNPAKRFDKIYPKVWVHDKGITPTDKLTDSPERENKRRFGAFRRKHLVGDDWKLEFIARSPGTQCAGVLLAQMEGVTAAECEEYCGNFYSLNTIEVCRCATFKNPTDPVLGTCMLRNIPEEDLVPASGPLPASCSGKLCVKAPVSAAVNSTVLHPVMWQFEHRASTSEDVPHFGYRDTPGFVEFLDLTNTAVVAQDESTKRLKYIAKDQMMEIFGGGFVTRQTASLALDFLAYHVNYQYYCWLQFTFQFLPEGGIRAKFQVEALPSQELQASMVPFGFWPDWILVICMGTWILIELRKLGRRIYKSPWLLADLAWIGFGIQTIWLNRSLFTVDAATNQMELFAATSTSVDFSSTDDLAIFFTNFEKTMNQLQALLRFNSLFMLFTWLRIIKYLCDTSSHVGVLADTMKRASTAITFFVFIILLMLFGFVSWGSVYFGTKIYAFKGFRMSLMTCLDWTFGNIDVLDEMMAKDELASLFFVVFMLIIYFVFVNFNNAILNAAYDGSEQAYLAKKEVRAQDAAGKIGLFTRILHGAKALCAKCLRRKGVSRSTAGRKSVAHTLKERVTKTAILAEHAEEEPLEGESCRMIVLYCIFGVAYIFLLTELCHIGPSYAMHATVTSTIQNVAVEEQGRTLTIDGVKKQDDAVLWIQKALPKLLYGESTQYISDTRYPQLVLRDWTIFYGQLPVRLMMRLYNTTGTASAPDWLQDVGVQARYPYLRARPMSFLVNAGFHVHKVLPYRTDFNETDRIEDVQDRKQAEALSKTLEQVEQIDKSLLRENRRLCLPASQAREKRRNVETGDIIDTKVSNHTCTVVGPKAGGGWNSACGYRQGFVCSIPADKEIGEPMLDYLGESNFISDQTASVVLDFVLFNANVGLFTYVAIEFTFPPSGTLEKNIFTSSMRLNPYDGGAGTWRMCLFGGFVALWAFFVVDEVISLGKEFLANKEKNTLVRVVKTLVEHFTQDFYNVLDATSYAISAMTVSSWMAYLNAPIRQHFIFPEEPVWEELKCEQSWCADDDIIQEFYLLSIKFRTFVRVASINCLIICIRVLKFFRGDEKMQVVIGTLINSLTRIMWFFVMLGLILMGFVTMAHIGFGTKIISFCSLENAVMTSFQMVIGNYDYGALDRADEMLALIFFLPFMLIFFFVLMNIFLAIIDKSFRDQEHAFQERQRRRKRGPKHGMFRRLRLAFSAVAGRQRAHSEDKKEALSPVKGRAHMNGHGHEKVETGKPVTKGEHKEADAVEASEVMEKCREAATSDRAGPSRDVAVSWLLMDDAKQRWALDTITRLNDDLNKWNSERHDMAGDELKEWIADTLESELDERIAHLQQQVAVSQMRNKSEVMHELGEAMAHQDVLCVQIKYLLDELDRTEGLRDENEQTYSRLREAASALIFGKQEGAEEDEG